MKRLTDEEYDLMEEAELRNWEHAVKKEQKREYENKLEELKK